MSRLQALRDALRPLGIYKLEKGTLVYAELAAYAAGLDLLEDGLDELEREAFLPHRPGGRNLQEGRNLWQAQNLAAFAGTQGNAALPGSYQ